MTISATEQRLLGELLAYVKEHGSYPPYEQFRVDHEHDRTTLDQMEKQRLILRDSKRYVLSLDGLRACYSEEAFEELEGMVRVLPFLKDAYRESYDKVWGTQELADRAGVSELAMVWALSFLRDIRVEGAAIWLQLAEDQSRSWVTSIRFAEPILDLTEEMIRGVESEPAAPVNTGEGVAPARSMYLESLRLENVRILADQDFSFRNADGSPRMWTVFIGDNGRCKTTILQAIALAASGEGLSRTLVDSATHFKNAADLARTTSLTASFQIQEGSGRLTQLNLSLEALPELHSFRGRPDLDSAQIDEVRDRRVPGYFVAAYGVGRFLPRPGEVAIPENLHRDRVEGLFDDRHKMLGLYFLEALRRQRGEKGAERFVERLGKALRAQDESGNPLLPGLMGLVYGLSSNGQGMQDTKEFRAIYQVAGGGYQLRPTALSHGYQGMIAWISDLIGHGLLEFGDDTTLEELSGIVLIDEIDLHLHPSWQRRIVPVLRRLFPKLQFIVTTHSPLVLTGFEQHEIVRLEVENGLVVQRPSPFAPGLSTSSEILSGFYGVQRAARPSLVEKEARYLELLGYDELPIEHQGELAELERELRPYLAEPPEDEEEDEETEASEGAS